MFYRIHRKSQMFSYLLICPVPAGKHRDGIFQRCQKIRHCFLHLWVMDFHPAAAESDYPVHQFLIDFRLTFSYAGFQYPLQQSVIFYKRFQESVFSRHLPAGRYRYSGSLLILLINLTHGCHTIQIDHRDRICPLCHCHRSLHHSLCPRILPVQISHMSKYADSEQPLPDRKIRKITIQRWCSLFRQDMDQNRQEAMVSGSSSFSRYFLRICATSFLAICASFPFPRVKFAKVESISAERRSMGSSLVWYFSTL